jgi:hypothetical protein
VGNKIDSRPLEHNLQTDVREGWSPPKHHIAVPELVFVQEMETVARERFGGELYQLTCEARVAIEEEISDPIHWSVQSNHHTQECPSCLDAPASKGATTL